MIMGREKTSVLPAGGRGKEEGEESAGADTSACLLNEAHAACGAQQAGSPIPAPAAQRKAGEQGGGARTRAGERDADDVAPRQDGRRRLHLDGRRPLDALSLEHLRGGRERELR